MTFPDHGFVLLALPKTASTTLERALAPYAALAITSPPARKHLPARGFEREFVPALAARGHPRESYEVVTMFRDPIDWLESWWRYRARKGARPANSTAGLPFEDFARSYVDGDPSAPTPSGRPSRFISVRGVVAVDRVFSLNRPDVWGPWFCERLGRPLDFGRRNVATAVRGELSDATRTALTEHFAPEYDVWHRLADAGEWAGARGTRLNGSAGPSGQ